jgi:chemotaxis protein MotB
LRVHLQWLPPVSPRRLGGLLLCWLIAGTSLAAEPSRDELERLRGYVADINQRLVEVQQQLIESEQRSHSQATLIDRLQRELEKDNDATTAARRVFVERLNERLPASVVFRLEGDRLLIQVKPVYVHGTGELGAEGQQRLQPMVAALRDALAALPDTVDWQLRIEGHTDARALRGNARFPSNWELSATRAVEMLRYLAAEGIDQQNMYAVALAANRPLVEGDDPEAYRTNRRIEIHLELSPIKHAGTT